MSIIHIYDNSSKIVFAAYPDGEIKKLNDKGADLYIMGDSYYIQFKLYLDSSGNEITRLYAPIPSASIDWEEIMESEWSKDYEPYRENVTVLDKHEDSCDFFKIYNNIEEFSIVEEYSDDCRTFWQWDQYTLSVWNSRLYIVSDDTGKIISALIAPNTDLQLGDGDSIAYRLNNNTVILENCGDVCSVVIIKCQD